MMWLIVTMEKMNLTVPALVSNTDYSHSLVVTTLLLLLLLLLQLLCDPIWQ